jgi:hypothetical protein
LPTERGGIVGRDTSAGLSLQEIARVLSQPWSAFIVVSFIAIRHAAVRTVNVPM